MKIWTPATSANLGPGFDSMGLALNMGNHLEIVESEVCSMEGQPENITRIEDHLIYQAMVRTWQIMGRKPRNIAMKQNDEIPGSRGLGSSAACIVAGVAAANALEGELLSRRDCIDISAQLEGHPDNALPAWEGGICVSVMEEGKVDFVRLAPPKGLTCAALIPDHPLSTAKARSVLPDMIPRKDGVFNAGRAALLAAALAAGDLSVLEKAVQDKLHQTYRAPLIPDYETVTAKMREMGAAAAFLSGAGPTIMTWWRGEAPEETVLNDALAGLVWGWKARCLRISEQGVVVEK